MNYKKVNLYLGWLVFLIATVIFFITIEDTVSLWDCGEYITAAYKLEVGHPPGAPTFMVLGRLFSFFADPENVAVWINRLSALSSSLTILFMFWSITLFVKKIALRGKKSIDELSLGDKIAILGSGVIGGLAYTFSDSFWFSAVEGEVYAMSSLFTAVIFWAILKWDEEMMEIQTGIVPKEYSPDRWLLLIMFMLGLAIGVHLLGILVVPAITYIIYFRYAEKVNVRSFLLVGILGIIILGFIQVAVIPGTISIASSFEVSFRNSLGMPFYSGTIFFFALFVAVCIFVIRWARKKGRRIVYSAVMGLILLLIGYGSFAVIVIRSNANTPLDENDPENLVTLHAYLKREQYGSAPILNGPHWNANLNDPALFDDLSAFYLRRFVVKKGDKVLKAYEDEKRAQEYAKTVNGAEVEELYYESNAATRHGGIPTYAQTTFFPRMYWNQDQQRINGYIRWSGYDASEDVGTEKGKDGKRLASMGENLTFFTRYQLGWMYWRYFMWNFTGRQNDIQGHGDHMRGNWISGFSAVDDARLGDQGENTPFFTKENKSNNRFYFLPFILGIIGLVFHFYRTPKDAFVLLLVFLFTGIAINIYLNPRPFEPRERDYAYAGSFYFFAMWIGIGVYALYESFKSFGSSEYKRMGILAAAGLVLAFAIDIGNPVAMPTTVAWVIMLAIGGGVLGLMTMLRRVLKKDMQGAVVASLFGLFVPIIMGMQGWDDHDRSNKTTAHNVALNYLNSCEKNGILFTNGDNDTFPLWYMQEVEEKRTDVRVCNLSLMQTDWYTNQMKMKAYDSDPLPIEFTEDQILMYSGNTDQVLFMNLVDMFFLSAKEDVIKKVIALRGQASQNELMQGIGAFNAQATNLLATATAKDPRAADRLTQIKTYFTQPFSSESYVDDVYNKYQGAMEVLSASQSGLINMSEKGLQALQKLVMDFEKSWNYSNLADAMAFTRDDDNLVNYQGRRLVRIFPSNGFVLPVNKENAVKSGVITEEQKDQCLNELKFAFDERGLTREQVMMLDIMGNNDWKRSIAYSSPGGSDVSIALYRRGYIKQNGMVFELSPLNDMNNRFNDEKMYKNLMENYDYGTMNDPDVVTDYYARRHSDQYRLHFLSLAEHYVTKALRAEENNSRIDMMVEMNPNANVPKKTTQKEIDADKKKAANLINRSLEVMPAELVLDYGETSPGSNPREQYNINGKSLQPFTDGVLHDYVGILYMAGDNKSAEKLGATVAGQLESILDYYDKSNVGLSLELGHRNTEHLYAALSSYIKLMGSAVEFGGPQSELAKRTRKRVDYVYNTMIPSIKDRLKELANNNGESVRRGSNSGKFATMLFDFEDYTEAIAIHYELLDTSTPAPEVGGPPTIEDLMNQQPMQDSVEPH